MMIRGITAFYLAVVMSLYPSGTFASDFGSGKYIWAGKATPDLSQMILGKENSRPCLNITIPDDLSALHQDRSSLNSSASLGQFSGVRSKTCAPCRLNITLKTSKDDSKYDKAALDSPTVVSEKIRRLNNQS